jgi:small subunit ribosomal protein S16
LSVRIRLKRAGSRHRPFYRIVVADSRSARDGREIEALGHYNPVAKPEVIEFDEDRLNHWVSKGAGLSESVDALVRRRKRRSAREGAPETEEAAEPAGQAQESASPAAEAATATASEEEKGAEDSKVEVSDAGETGEERPEAAGAGDASEGESEKE